MKKISKILVVVFLFLSMFTLLGCPSPQSGVNCIANDELVQTSSYVKWEGRYEYKAPSDNAAGRVYLYHTATGFTVTFTGTKLEVDFFAQIKNGDGKFAPHYNVAVDDETLPNPDPQRRFTLQEGSQTVTVVDGLSNGTHTVTCLKMNEANDAVTAVERIETDGTLVARDKASDESNFRFMMVCASGGSGYGSLSYAKTSNKPRTAANSSSLHAFNYLAARRFDADVQFVATSGWGVQYPKSIVDILDYTGNLPANTVSAAKTTAKWDYQAWIPDVILFNIGGNDTTQSNFDDVVYKQRVVELVTKLHAEYPYAVMLWIHTNSNAGKYAMSALSDCGAVREGYIQEVVIPKVGVIEDGSYGAANHNSFTSHIKAGDIIADKLAQEWGFTPFVPDVNFADFDNMLQKY